MLEEKLDSGYSVYNYYNSYDLAVKLLDRQTYCTGTLGKSRKGNPIELGTITLRKGENKYLFLNNVHIGKSLAHSAEDIETSSIPILDEAVDTKSKQILVYSWFRNELTVKKLNHDKQKILEVHLPVDNPELVKKFLLEYIKPKNKYFLYFEHQTHRSQFTDAVIKLFKN